jgi:hypothetical protein
MVSHGENEIYFICEKINKSTTSSISRVVWISPWHIRAMLRTTPENYALPQNVGKLFNAEDKSLTLKHTCAIRPAFTQRTTKPLVRVQASPEFGGTLLRHRKTPFDNAQHPPSPYPLRALTGKNG